MLRSLLHKIIKKACRIFPNKLTIKKERQGGAEYLETQSMKIKLSSSKYYSEASVGITVLS